MGADGTQFDSCVEGDGGAGRIALQSVLVRALRRSGSRDSRNHWKLRVVLLGWLMRELIGPVSGTTFYPD